MAKRGIKSDEMEAEEGPAWSQTLIGHANAESDFLRAVAKDRMPHAWMITGPKGVGKATLAYRMARRLLRSEASAIATEGGLFGAEAPPADHLDMAPSNPIFRRIAQQSHPDFRVLGRAINPKTGKMRNEIVVDDVRDVIDFMHLKPAMGGWRVVIVDCADDLNRNAANALLKMLEEPPARSVLILLANAPRALLPTLVSRCRRLGLRPLSETQIAAALADRFPGLGREELSLAALLSEGSLGRAIRIVEGDGGALFGEIGATLSSWPVAPTSRLHALAERMVGRAGEAQFELASEMLGWWFGRFLRRAARNGAPETDLFVGEAALIERMAQAASLDRWLELWEKVRLIFGRVRDVNMDRKQAWVAAMLVLSGRTG